MAIEGTILDQESRLALARIQQNKKFVKAFIIALSTGMLVDALRVKGVHGKGLNLRNFDFNNLKKAAKSVRTLADHRVLTEVQMQGYRSKGTQLKFWQAFEDGLTK